MSNEINHLQYWLENLKKDSRLNPQQFFTLEKAILLAISMFEKNAVVGQVLPSNNAKNDEQEEPMEIDE